MISAFKSPVHCPRKKSYQEVKDRVRPKAFFTEQSVNPLTWRRKPEVWRRRTRTQVLEDMTSEQFSLHCTLSRIRGLFTRDNYCCDFGDINWTFWKWWFANIKIGPMIEFFGKWEKSFSLRFSTWSKNLQDLSSSWIKSMRITGISYSWISTAL